MKKLSLLLIGIIAATRMSAQVELKKLLEDNRSYLQCSNGKCTGPGWDFLSNNIKESKYFLLGEDHGTKEIPEIALAISSVAKFDKAVVEVDGLTAAEMYRACKMNATNKKTWLDAHQSMLSFYSAQDEFKWLDQMVQQGANVWGLDQVSVFSDRLLLELLAKNAKSDAAKKAAASALKTATDGFNEFLQTGNRQAPFMFKSDSNSFATLKAAFANESAENKHIVDEIAESSSIYKNWQKGSHAQRVKLMKHNLKVYMDKDSKGKMFFKFVAAHLSKGESFVNIFDIGNMVDNLADATYEKTFALMVVGAKGTANSFINIKGAETHPIDAMSADSDIHFLEPLISLVDAEKSTLFDLRPLKKAIFAEKLSVDNANLRRAIVGYDAILIVPQVSASH